MSRYVFWLLIAVGGLFVLCFGPVIVELTLGSESGEQAAGVARPLLNGIPVLCGLVVLIAVGYCLVVVARKLWRALGKMGKMRE